MLRSRRLYREQALIFCVAAVYPSPLAGGGRFAQRSGVRGLYPRGQLPVGLADRDPSSGASRHLLPQGEKEAGQNTFLIQLCGSLVRPYWMSTSFLRMPIATGPAAPPLIRKSPLAEQTLPIGEITAAVPQAKASFSLPLAASLRHWSIE